MLNCLIGLLVEGGRHYFREYEALYGPYPTRM